MAVASVVVDSLMRYAEQRRPQIRGGRAYSTGAALAGALRVFVVFGFLIRWLLE